ncbi:iron uptake system protein EfeO [Actinomadura sp. PM05-2]|uniref:Iron uptake system protein EfeO n=2 Tax=Actinomadura parmotrematis TaxID=2864039 RepID=A0ABS7G4M3_9ACTN|nr:iron uptake system protein EfeO [Actinomadura parmotrematis]
MRFPLPALALSGVAALALPLLTACGDDGDKDAKAAAGGPTAVTAGDARCEVARKDFAAGVTEFKVRNTGSRVTELYVYAPGDKIVGERENIGPGTSATLAVQLSAGKYQLACKPGMVGNGIRQDITVTGVATKGADPRIEKALTDYHAYVIGQTDATIAATQKFVAAFKAGDVAKAKALYAPSRVGWESIEPVAESFGDLDPRTDAREADLKPGEKWTGWHRLEKALWKTGSTKGEEAYADQLLKDLAELKTKVNAVRLDPPITQTSMANGAKELLDEVATGKITGEEETFSHTDLVDFQANLDGAAKVYELLRPVVQEKDATLAKDLDDNFAKVRTALQKHRQGDGYVSYDKVGKDDRKALSDAVNALAEPLSKLAGVVSK